jgi:cytochrome c biogenesis protein CcdA
LVPSTTVCPADLQQPTASRQVLPLRLPSLDVDVRRLPLPPALTAYLAGATFALAASPCSTPILATLLAYVSASGDPLRGGALLMAYSLGYVAPLLFAASATVGGGGWVVVRADGGQAGTDGACM